MNVICPKESRRLDPLEKCSVCGGIGYHVLVEKCDGNHGGPPCADPNCWNDDPQPGNEGGRTEFDKQTNPKDAIGAGKLPLHLIPGSALGWLSLSFLEGALKYGKYNWRVAGVRASIYADAAERHLRKWLDGEDSDPETGVPHLASIMACCAIIMDAACVGKLVDDRPPRMMTGALYNDLMERVAHLKETFKDYDPIQWTEEIARGHERAERRVLSEVPCEPEGEEAAGSEEQGTQRHAEGRSSLEGGWEGGRPQEGLIQRRDERQEQPAGGQPEEEPELQARREEPTHIRYCGSCGSRSIASDPRAGAECRVCNSREIRWRHVEKTDG